MITFTRPMSTTILMILHSTATVLVTDAFARLVSLEGIGYASCRRPPAEAILPPLPRSIVVLKESSIALLPWHRRDEADSLPLRQLAPRHFSHREAILHFFLYCISNYHL